MEWYGLPGIAAADPQGDSEVWGASDVIQV